MPTWKTESLIHDPVHGYIPFTSRGGCGGGVPGEISEEEIIDDPWVQRLRQIHQLQTAWWVFPTAEHSRFQHVIGAMHLASRVMERLYPSLRDVCDAAATTERERTPSRAYVESLMRMAALLHDVGHGPFGHFFDEHFLVGFGLNHEKLGARIIIEELGDRLRRVQRNPNGVFEQGETLDPHQIAYLIRRPQRGSEVAGELVEDTTNDTAGVDCAASDVAPRWLRMLRSLFCGLYTVDNMDFVLRDAYMSGFANHSFDIDRLLRYTLFTERGLTIHGTGFSTLIRFLIVRSELFRTIYFHRMVRAIDLELETIFHDGKELLFGGDPTADAASLARYRDLTEWSLQVDLTRWSRISETNGMSADDTLRRRLGLHWQRLAAHEWRWKMVCEKSVFFTPQNPESTSIFAHRPAFEHLVRNALPAQLRNLKLRFDFVTHNHRPENVEQNFLYDPATDCVQRLDAQELLRQLPVTWKICRIYAENSQHMKVISETVDRLLGRSAGDDLTNM